MLYISNQNVPRNPDGLDVDRRLPLYVKLCEQTISCFNDLDLAQKKTHQEGTRSGYAVFQIPSRSKHLYCFLAAFTRITTSYSCLTDNKSSVPSLKKELRTFIKDHFKFLSDWLKRKLNKEDISNCFGAEFLKEIYHLLEKTVSSHIDFEKDSPVVKKLLSVMSEFTTACKICQNHLVQQAQNDEDFKKPESVVDNKTFEATK